MKIEKVNLEAIGLRLARERIRKGLTQAELAKEAGIGKRTLERLENGESVQLGSFIRVLGQLDLLGRLIALLPDPQPSPIQLFEGVEEPRRVYKQRKPEAPAKPWVWEEDR
ncbi:MAG: helix-turn-helix domain-containing protein [Opitutales bacterium]